MLDKKFSMPKEVWIGWLASLIEAYNMAIYSFLAPFLAPLLFKKDPETTALFFSYALVFIGTCLLYPLGAIYYGLLGDKEGRQKTCVSSTLGLGLATGMLGLLPSGILESEAWIFFLLFISVQHFFSGGEYHGSIVFSLEHAEEKGKGLMSALSCLFAVFGLVMANGMATFALYAQSLFWMKLCFLLGAGGGVLSYFLKNRCRETPVFVELPQALLKGINWSQFIQEEWKKILTVVAGLAFFSVSYTFVFLFLPAIYREQALNFDTFKSLIAYGVLLMCAGVAADRIGVEKLMRLGIWLFALLVFPLSYLCDKLLILQLLLTFCISLFIGPIHSWMLGQFEPKCRCRGIFLSAALATALFGGSTMPICLMLFDNFHSTAICALYPLLLSIGVLICFYLLKEKMNLSH